MITWPELVQHLSDYWEVTTLVETLNISTQDIIERFSDRLEEHFVELENNILNDIDERE